jgi:hypothetical protein
VLEIPPLAVESIDLASDLPVVFGPFVLRRATQLVLDRIHLLTAEAVGRSANTPEDQVSIEADLRRYAAESLKGNVVLEFEVMADAEQAHAVFLEKANILMDLLQMSTKIAEFCGSARVGLSGHAHSGRYSAWVLPMNPGGWSQPNKRTGGIGDLSLHDGNLFLMRKAGVTRLAEVLGREATLLENALFRAAQRRKPLALPKQVHYESCEIDGLTGGSIPLARGASPGFWIALRVVLSGPRWRHGSQIGLRTQEEGCFIYGNRANAGSHAINEWLRYANFCEYVALRLAHRRVEGSRGLAKLSPGRTPGWPPS